MTLGLAGASPVGHPTRAARLPPGAHNPGRPGSTPGCATTDPRHDGRVAACNAADAGFDSRVGLQERVCSTVKSKAGVGWPDVVGLNAYSIANSYDPL